MIDHLISMILQGIRWKFDQWRPTTSVEQNDKPQILISERKQTHRNAATRMECTRKHQAHVCCLATWLGGLEMTVCGLFRWPAVLCPHPTPVVSFTNVQWQMKSNFHLFLSQECWPSWYLCSGIVTRVWTLHPELQEFGWQLHRWDCANRMEYISITPINRGFPQWKMRLPINVQGCIVVWNRISGFLWLYVLPSLFSLIARLEKDAACWFLNLWF